MAEGFVYQGEISKHSGASRGGSRLAHLPTTSFVICLQNHDQIGNRAMGERLTQLAEPASPARRDSACCCCRLSCRMLFMGEEVSSTHAIPVLHQRTMTTLAKLVKEGRRAEFKHFAAFQDPERREKIPDPNAPTTFHASVPEFTGDSSFVHKPCLTVRRERPSCPASLAAAACGGRGTRASSALVARWRLGTGATLVAIAINLGDEKPALAPAGPQATRSSSAPIGAWDGLPCMVLPTRALGRCLDRARSVSLHDLAEAGGLALRWKDVHGQWHEVGDETLRLCAGRARDCRRRPRQTSRTAWQSLAQP